MDHELKLIAEAYNQALLLEKDHRKKMIKFIDEDVANFLHEFDDKRSMWFANQIKQMEGFQSAKNRPNWISRFLIDDMRGIIDWVSNTPNILLKKYDWATAVQAHKDYHESLQTNSLEGMESHEIIKKYDDGFYWVDLETNQCSEEKDAMGHCATSSSETLFSLRKYTLETNSVESFITIAANPDDGSWQQAKGKNNSKPKEVYHPYIADILAQYELYNYKTEYQGENDFNHNDFREYVEANPDSFEDADEIIHNIDGNSISSTDFEEALTAHQVDNEWTNVSVVVFDDDMGDGMNYVSAAFDLYITIPADKFKYDIKSVVEDLGYQQHNEFVGEMFDDIGLEDPEAEVYEDSILLKGRFNTSDSDYKADEDGLASFKGELAYADNVDSGIDIDDVIEKVNKYVYENELVETSFSRYVDELEASFEDEFTHIDSVEIEGFVRDVDFEVFNVKFDMQELFRQEFAKTNKKAITAISAATLKF
jgi:hypothetical protein